MDPIYSLTIHPDDIRAVLGKLINYGVKEFRVSQSPAGTWNVSMQCGYVSAETFIQLRLLER